MFMHAHDHECLWAHKELMLKSVCVCVSELMLKRVLLCCNAFHKVSHFSDFNIVEQGLSPSSDVIALHSTRNTLNITVF